MTKRDNILNELSLLDSNLGNIGNANLYEVPAGYFEGLAEQVMNRIRAIDNSDVSEELKHLAPSLAGISKESPYALPDGYFDGLEEKLMQSLREKADYQTPQEELAAISPLLSGLSKQTPYTVPDGYFEKTETRKSTTKVISITNRKWFRYAAAAVVIGVVAIGAVVFINSKSVKPLDDERAWAKVEKKVEKLSDEEIKDFVEFNDAGLTANETAGLEPVKKEELKDLLKDISDNEIKEFLEQTSDGLDDVSLLN